MQVVTLHPHLPEGPAAASVEGILVPGRGAWSQPLDHAGPMDDPGAVIQAVVKEHHIVRTLVPKLE
jgi:hypothetical protein